jgi:hypothetical protein
MLKTEVRPSWLEKHSGECGIAKLCEGLGLPLSQIDLA